MSLHMCVQSHPYPGKKSTLKRQVKPWLCRVVTTKNKEGYPSTLTKQNAQGWWLYVQSTHLKTRKEIQVPLQRDMGKKNLTWFVEVWLMVKVVLLSLTGTEMLGVQQVCFYCGWMGGVLPLAENLLIPFPSSPLLENLPSPTKFSPPPTKG